MNDIHSDYLKDEHFEDEEDEELNMNSQKSKNLLTKPFPGKSRLKTMNWKIAFCKKCSKLNKNKVSTH